MGRQGLDFSSSIWGQMAGVCECGNVPAGSLKSREFLDLLRNW